MSYIDKPISGRLINQDDRIEIADRLADETSVKEIAERIGKSYQSVYREIARNRKGDGTYQPWLARSQAHMRRRRARQCRFEEQPELARAVAEKLEKHWSPAQICRWLKRRWPHRASWHVCHETIYEAVYRGDVAVKASETLRTGRSYRHHRWRGRNRQGALGQLTNFRSISEPLASVTARRRIGHWAGDLIIWSERRSAMAALVERKTRYAMLVRLPGSHTA